MKIKDKPIVESFDGFNKINEISTEETYEYDYMKLIKLLDMCISMAGEIGALAADSSEEDPICKWQKEKVEELKEKTDLLLDQFQLDWDGIPGEH